MTAHTLSEELFEEYCTSRSYTCKRIEILPGQGRFPDYEIRTAGGGIVCEVKEITPNKKEKVLEGNLAIQGGGPYRRSIGKRARAALVEASDQLKRFEHDPRPCVVVLFDATQRGHYLSPPDLDAAMFGRPMVVFRDGDTPLLDSHSGFTHIGDRKLTERRKRYISAVAVLLPSSGAVPIRLDLYHNPYATKPLRPSYFPQSADRHFVKGGHPDRSGHSWWKYVVGRKGVVP